MDKQKHPQNPVNIKYVNHGDVFNRGHDWFTFYCGNCGTQIEVDTRDCEKCGAILQRENKT